MKLTPTQKQTFNEAIREAVACRDRWHLPAKIWLIAEPGALAFEAHPDTVRPGGTDTEILMELSADQLHRLAEAADTPQWDTEVEWLLERTLSRA